MNSPKILWKTTNSPPLTTLWMGYFPHISSDFVSADHATQLILTIDDLARGLNDKQQIDAVLLDFCKEFDNVPHQRLLLKLKHYGVRGNILSWIEDFLSARTQEIIIEGSKSSPSPVMSGVPQGTVLGPLLFLAYINDMPECVKSEIKLFADDSLLYRRIQNLPIATSFRKS